MRRLTHSLLLAVAILAFGCAQEPGLEVIEAQQALAAARDAEAERYATEEYEIAVSNLEGAIDAIQRQREEPLWARDYSLADDLLIYSIESSERAVEIADTIRMDASLQVEQLLPEAQTAIDLAFVQLEQVRGANVVSVNTITRLDANLQSATTLVRRARGNREAGDYSAAAAEAQEAIELADAVRIEAEEINVYAAEVGQELEERRQQVPAFPEAAPVQP